MVIGFGAFAFDPAVGIGHKDDPGALGGVDGDSPSGMTQKPGGIGAVVAREFGELVKDL